MIPFARARACLVIAVALALPLSARAGDGPVGRAAVEGDLLSYYGGEQTAAYLVLALSVAAGGVGAWGLSRGTSFGRGLGWPLLSLGALEAIGSVSYAFQVRAEIADYQALLARDPAGFQRTEIEHIDGTARRFIYYRLVELTLTVAGAGFATYGLASGHEVYQGLGIGLFSIGLPFLIIDTVNNNRAADYAAQLRRFDLKVGFEPAAHGGVLALGGRI